MDLNLKGRSVLITGGSRGIGAAIARVLAEEGCNLHLAARNTELLKSYAQELQSKFKVAVETYPADLSLTAEVEALAKKCADVDILVNNAGGIPRGYIEDIDGETWRKAWDLKVFGFIDLTRRIFPRMCARGSGVIVNVIGMAGERPDPRYIAGATGNAALNMFTLCLGGESVRHGVRVCAVNPGPIMSDRFREGMEKRAATRFGDQNRWPELLVDFPVGRAGNPEEVAYSVAFLASDRASYISGEALRIDAGLRVRAPIL